MKTKDKVILFTICALVFFWIIYLVKSVLTPFIFSLIIAYLLNPITTYLSSKTKISRLFATSLIIGLFFAILIAASLFIAPIIYSESIGLIEALPEYLEVLSNDLYPQIVTFAAKFGIVLQNDIFSLADEWHLTDYLLTFSQNLARNLLGSTMVLINIVSLIFITPILVFYLLNDWEIFVAKTRSYLPKNAAKQIEEVLIQIDQILSGYIRGQINVCLILGVIYAASLSFIGLDFGFLIGFLTGLFSFVPYIGMLFGVTVAIVISLFQWGFDSFHIALVAGVFLLGQFIEANFLTPKLIGKKIGLHPIWVVFGLFFFGALFGFVGVLIAVPLTAVCGVIIRFFALKYKKRFT
jgi:predicted PurR-regulated permease PerM